MKKVYLLFLAASITLSSCKTSKYPDLADGLYADIQTTHGDIVVKLEYDKTPITVANFISLAEGTSTFVSDDYKGKKYYDGLIFHRVMKGFMIQGGDPMGSGAGGPGYKFMDEFNDSLIHDKKGILSMANPGPDANGSQFFITHAPTSWLNNRHSIFGEVVKGIAVVDSIANVKVAAGNRPVTEVKMNTIEIIRNGKAAKQFDAVAVMTEYFDNEGERLAAIEKEKAEKAAMQEKVKSDFVASLADQKAKAKELPSGLKILSILDSKGEKPRIGSTVPVMYAGYLEDGTLFDTNYEEVAIRYNTFDESRKQGGGYEGVNMPFSPDAQIIPGFREGLLSMKVGDKVRIFIPSHLGYGPQGSRGVIPPDANLVFDLEIINTAN